MKTALALLLLLAAPLSLAAAEAKPNIVLIYADDIGYGDLSCYGAVKVKTPNCDRLAAEGLRFTDAHSVASVCTPSRYAMLSGQYAFRKSGTGIARGIEGLLLDPSKVSLASVLKGAGYTTGVVGKWHLGLGTTPTDYNTIIKPGPREVGFDYAWLLPATGDRVPCVWVENDRVVNLDPADPIKLDYSVQRGEPRSFVNGVPRIGEQLGGKAALWDDENMSTVIAAKSCAFIEQNKAKRFFLYMATHNIHVPRVPNPKFRGQSDCGVRGDTIVEFDWTVGQVLAQLDRLGLSANTLVVLSSDNGGVLDNNGPDAVHGIGSPDGTNGHKPNGVLRGFKGSVWEGGTRLPLIVRWPGRVKPGTSAALMSQMDFLASFAALTGGKVPAGQAIDSENHLAALLGNDPKGREYLVEQSNNGAPFALRHGTWKYLPTSGGRGAEREVALFDLATDLSETKNLAAAQPQRVAAMQAKLTAITGQALSGTPGGKGKKGKAKQGGE